VKLVKLKKTCSACPAQWEGKLEDGRMVYVRYRWGYLSVRVSENKTEDITDAVRGKEIFGVGVGDSMSGTLEFVELVGVTGHILDYSNVQEKRED